MDWDSDLPWDIDLPWDAAEGPNVTPPPVNEFVAHPRWIIKVSMTSI